MILEHLSALNQKHIVLASASPRRAELLRQVGFQDFEVIPSKFAEGLDKNAYGGPAGYARETARCKAQDVADSLRQRGKYPDLIIGADTVVEIDDLVLEKPIDSQDAARMLRRSVELYLSPPALQEDEHAEPLPCDVLAGDAGSDPLVHSSASKTLVEFDDLSDSAIDAYIATGEPFDKAGSYGCQGPAGLWIRRMEGCYFNVMGLPLHDLASAIRRVIDSGHL